MNDEEKKSENGVTGEALPPSFLQSQAPKPTTDAPKSRKPRRTKAEMEAARSAVTITNVDGMSGYVPHNGPFPQLKSDDGADEKVTTLRDHFRRHHATVISLIALILSMYALTKH